MNRVRVQKVLLPDDERLHFVPDLFYRGCRCVQTAQGELMIPKGIVIDFTSCLNGVPANKWRSYTSVSRFGLHVCVVGKGTINLVGYSNEPLNAVRKLLGTQTFDYEVPTEIELPYPDNDRELLGFEIEAHDDCRMCGGWYWGESDAEPREINILVSTTTCRKEEYILHNLDVLRKDILEADDSFKEHFYINVVDNGNTLHAEDVEADHIRLIPNVNTGGSGGFARGMIEGLHDTRGITHIVLMDDDVLMLSDSYRRLYGILQYIRPEYERSLFSGAMFEMDQMTIMHEDIGTLRGNKDFTHVKREHNMSFLADIIDANRRVPRVDHDYAGWWFCCIPMDVVKEKGLPLPLFIRGDDVEYGIRCNLPILTMTGICVWHMGFANKFTSSMNFYQEFRNIFIVKDVTGHIDDVDMFTRWKGEIGRAWITFNYDGAEALMCAMEDYMKGPSYIEEDHGFELVRKMSQYNEHLEPLSETEPNHVLMGETRGDVPLSLFKRVIYYLTYNGQRYVPASWNRDSVGYVSWDWGHLPGRCYRVNRILAVNAIDRTGCMRTIDRKRFKEQYARFKRYCKEYERRHEELRKAYAGQFSYMTSETFWRKYLGLDAEN